VRNPILFCSIVTLGVSLATAQPVPQEPNRVREMVEAGAAPRAALDKLQTAAADQEDEFFLKRTLYGDLRVEDISQQQGEEMVAAARRRVERAQREYDRVKALVTEGVFARNTLIPLQEELDHRQRTLELAEGRAKFLIELSEMARAEADFAAAAAAASPVTGPRPVSVRFDGDGSFSAADWKNLVLAYEKEFGKPMPVSAHGETAVHKSLGFDHRGRIDVALSPDQPEGVWLRAYLEKEQIPHFLFRAAVSGKATGPHIHIGPPSLRLRIAD